MPHFSKILQVEKSGHERGSLLLIPCSLYTAAAAAHLCLIMRDLCEHNLIIYKHL